MNVALAVGALFALFGIYMFGHSMASYRKAVASENWPSVTGCLTDVRLWGKRNIGGETIDAEKLIVEYVYGVNDRSYTSRSASFFTLMYPETLEFAKSHPADSDVVVYYNPNNPAESVLMPGRRKDKPFSDLILGAFGIVFGVVIAVLAWMGVIG